MGYDISYERVLNEIMAGNSVEAILPQLRQMPLGHRQRLLCAVCWMKEDIAMNSNAHASLVDAILTSQCPLFQDGKPTCSGHALYRLGKLDVTR